MDFQLAPHDMLRYWAGTPNQDRRINRLCRRTRTDVAERELSDSNGERFLVPGYGYVPRAKWPSRYSTTVLSNGVHV